MKKGIVIFALSVASLFGCASSSYSVGNDFPIEKAIEIQKGQTTAEQLTQIFGQPYSKDVVSASEEQWQYFYATGETKAQSYFITTDIQTTAIEKTLDVLIDDGIVVNYTVTQNNGPKFSVK